MKNCFMKWMNESYIEWIFSIFAKNPIYCLFWMLFGHFWGIFQICGADNSQAKNHNSRHRGKWFWTTGRRELQFAASRIINLGDENYEFLLSPKYKITKFSVRKAWISAKLIEKYNFRPTRMSIRGGSYMAINLTVHLVYLGTLYVHPHTVSR